MFGLDNLINLLFDSAMEKLGRNECVIQTLKRLNLDPDHPPEDFTGVYQYALVEYGIGKPRPTLEVFRQSEIQQLFREALEQNNPAKLLQHGEAFLADHPLQADLQANHIDVRREFYAFAAVFIEVAKRTRTPAAILAEQKLESLHRQIATVQERLSRLPTLEGLRTEMARLATTSSLALPAGESFGAEECKAFALAQQMRGWFETLGFRLEPHEIWQDDYFEWIINIPVRRGRYDRILVRCIDGEAGLRDVEALKQSVKTHRTDEGWLVTARRISRAARDEVGKPENDGLGCYTLDELLDQDADFSGYLTWLEAEIQKRGIAEKYVSLACLKEEIDPDTKQRLGVSRYDDRDGWIDGYIDLWLDDPAKEHISVLGEFGTGKTWFALHYAWKALQRYREARRRGLERPRLPLVIPLRDYAKAVSVESLFSEFFFRKHEIPIPGYSAFEQLNRMGKLLLIFDGFDEMAARVNRQEMINNFWELAKVVVPGAKVILTCRTEHFPEAKEGRALLNAELQASTRDLTGETPQFEVLELEKFNDEQIRQVLSHQAQAATVEQIMGNPQLLDLARRPVLTELILEALPDIEAGKPVDMSRIYLYAVRHKMERDIKEERTFTSVADKLYFMCELSWEMLSTDRMSINYREFPDRIRKLFGPVVQEEKDLDHWHYDMMGQTMLIRNAEGDYTPAHRSLLEFFVAYKFAAELGTLSDDFLQLAQTQENVSNYLQPQIYTWSNYFQLTKNAKKNNQPVPPLFQLGAEPIDKLVLTVGKSPLSKAIFELMLPMIKTLTSNSTNSLLETLQATDAQSFETAGYLGGNIATLMVKLNKSALSHQDLSGTNIRGANFVGAFLQETNLEDATLADLALPNTFGAIFTLAYDSSGNLLATGGVNRSVDIWDTENNRFLIRLKGHTNWVRALTFSSDGKYVISGSFDRTLIVWDLESRACVRILKGHESRINTVAISADSAYVASGSDDMTIRIWDFKSGNCNKVLVGHTAAVESVVIDDKSKFLISGSSDQIIKIWNLDTGTVVAELKGHTSEVRSITLSRNGEILASGARDQTIRLWNWKKEECIGVLKGHSDRRISTVTFNHDGSLLASGCYDSVVKIWDVEEQKCLRTLVGHDGWIRMIAFQKKTNIVTSVGDDQTIRNWDIETGECIDLLQGFTGEVRAISLSYDDRFLAAGCEDKTLQVWELVDFNNSLKYRPFLRLEAHQARINDVRMSPTQKVVATASFDHLTKLWDLDTGTCIKTLQGHSACVNAVAFTPDGQKLITASADCTIKVWDVVTGECIKILEGHDNWLWAVEVSPDGSLIASAGDDQTIRFWNLETGECCADLKKHKGGINSIAFTPNGSFLVSGGADMNIRIWDVHNKKHIKSWLAHESAIVCLEISPNSKYLFSSEDKGNIKIWDLKTQECLGSLRGHTDKVGSIRLTSDGSKLVSGSFDQTIKIWNVDNGQCLESIQPLRPYEGMNISRVKGLTELEKETLIALGAVES